MEPFDLGHREAAIRTALLDLGAALSFYSERDDENVTAWAEDVLSLSTSHPDHFIRSLIANAGTLRQVRALARDSHAGVRAACSDNPYNLDLGLQLAIAEVDDAVAISLLLKSRDPYREVVLKLVNSSHVWVRRRLAMMNLATDLLEILAKDENRKVRARAQEQLKARQPRKLTKVNW